MAQAYIVDYLRSPFALANKGALTGVRPDDLAAESFWRWSSIRASTPSSSRT